MADVATAGSGGTATTVPVCPDVIPQTWLAKSAHPRVFCTAQDLTSARATVRETDWGRKYLEKQRAACARFAAMTPAQLRALVPPPGCKIVYGLGMNLDPVHGQRVRWGGWNNPFTVVDLKGVTYPNNDWPDAGDGAVDPKTGRRYYFVARANGFVFEQLEQHILPALADVHALDGSESHARAAAVLIDAIAAVYPTNRRGPLDYPTSPGDEDRGGRLDRPYYQVARGLMNYGFVIDVLASGGELDKPSPAKPGMTIRENVVRSLLWDAGTYCLDYGVKGFQLHNGHADYVRGAAVVGLLLGVREFCEPMLSGPLSIYAMLDINIDRNGFYYETSPSYSTHCRELYVTIAELVEAARRIGWQGFESVYAVPAMRKLLTDTFNRQEVGGHVPTVGDDGPDRYVHDPMRRVPAGQYVYTDYFITEQLESAWVRLVRSQDGADRRAAAQLLRDSYGAGKPEPPTERWSVYHIGNDAIAAIQACRADAERFETGSVFHGAKGLAILRGGRGSKRFGAQLFFGPIHNHGQQEALTWTFFARGAEWSFDPGYWNTHLRFGFTGQSVAHHAVVVDRKSYNVEDGGGHLLAWHCDSQVQWAMARHPDAYQAEGVDRYERLIGQAVDPATGDLGYWLDVSRVVGGKVRDDSFHTQMTRLACDARLPESNPARPSLFGSKNLGDLIRPDLRLAGFDDKPFYWAPEGEGYGFLGNPREIAMPESVRLVLSSPSYAKSVNGVLIADLLGQPGRKLIVADGPKVAQEPRVPYIIRRDESADAGIFAKLVRLADDPAKDHVARFEPAALTSEKPGLARAWSITWRSGERDLWVVGDGSPARIESPGLPAVTTDALVAVLRFDGSGRLLRMTASRASHLGVAGGPALTGPAELQGRVTRLDPAARPAQVDVVWDHAPESIPQIPAGSVAVTSPPVGQPATWRIDSVTQDRVSFADVKLTLATTAFTPVAAKPGWYTLSSGISRFTSSGGRPNVRYALGKPVYHGPTLVGRVAELSDDGRSLKLVAGQQPAVVAGPFVGLVLEVAEGDEIVVPSSLTWEAQ